MKCTLLRLFLGSILIALMRSPALANNSGAVSIGCPKASQILVQPEWVATNANYALVTLVSISSPVQGVELFSGEKSDAQESLSPEVSNSVQNIAREKDRIDQKLATECDARVKEIYAHAQEKVAVLEQELQDRIVANGTPYPKYNKISLVPQWNQELRAAYNAKIDEVKEQAHKNIDLITALYKQKQAALDDSAVTLAKSYLNDKAASNIEVSPHGTNIYVRNYQTTDIPSGYTVPTLVAPPKSLLQHQSSKKVDSLRYLQ
jgi:hypothetical protein